MCLCPYKIVFLKTGKRFGLWDIICLLLVCIDGWQIYDVMGITGYVLNCVPSKIDVKVLTSIFRRWPYLKMGSFRGNQVKVRLLGWALIQYDWLLYKKREFGHTDKTHTEGRWCVDTQGKDSIYKQRSTSSYQKLGERCGIDLSPVSLKRIWPCRQVDCTLPTSRTVK